MCFDTRKSFISKVKPKGLNTGRDISGPVGCARSNVYAKPPGLLRSPRPGVERNDALAVSMRFKTQLYAFAYCNKAFDWISWDCRSYYAFVPSSIGPGKRLNAAQR
jgi:hypothetical protein